MGGGSDQPESDWAIVHFLTKASNVEINGVSFKRKVSLNFFYINSYNNFLNAVSSSQSTCVWSYADLTDFKTYGSSASNSNGKELSGNEIDFDTIESEEDKPLMMAFGSFIDHIKIQYLLFSAGYYYNYDTNSYAFTLGYGPKSLSELIVPDGPKLGDKCGILTIAINQPSADLDYMTLKFAPESGARAQNWMLIQDQSSNIKDLYNSWKQSLIPKTNFSKDRLITSGTDFIDFYSATENNGISFI